MKKLLLMAALALGMANLNAQTLEQTMYIDFGSNAGTNGAITPNPDVNLHYWNNPILGATGSTTAIVNNANAATGFSMEVTDSFIVNTSINYGPTLPTEDLLGDLAIGTATQDYFYLETGGSGNNTGQVTFSDLDPAKGYKFYVFASRPTNTVRTTSFAFAGLNTFNGSLQTSDGGTGNLSNILESAIISPNGEGQITLNVAIAEGAYGYINALKMEEYSDLPVTEVTSVAISGNNITVSGQTSQMTAVVLPADATYPQVNWSVDNTDVAIITEAGLLIPVSNGMVTVTATSQQDPDIYGTAEIMVSGQMTALYFSGSATENGDNPATSIPMHMVTGLEGTVSNIFEIYTSLEEAGTFGFYSSQETGATVYGEGTAAGSVEASGTAIDPAESGPVLITVNMNTNTYTITPINWSVVGSSITNGWSGDEPLTYQGNGVWSATLDMTVVGTDLNPRFVFRANQSWSYVMKKVPGTHDVVMESLATEYGIALQDIDLTYGNFIITLDLGNYTYGIACTDIDDYKITFIGSSGINGVGATDMHGYAWMYNELLQERATEGSSPFYRSNKGVNGNNTTNVLNRFEKDLLGDCSTYVIFGLVLGNEGIHDTGQVAFDSYEENLQLLVQMTKDAGKIPVVMNNYAREDYNAADHEFIKQMNLLMAQWDVPSTNMLGAIDNGTGNWATGYQFDALHPNDAGHAEMFHAVVPSLFDALEAGKPQPELIEGTYVTPNATGSGSLDFTPDNIVHPFTVSFDVKTTGTGNLMAFTTGSTNGTIAIAAEGMAEYTSPSGGTITTTAAINNGEWHKVTLTHFYARGETLLYVDGNAAGSVNENLEAQMFSLHGAGAPAGVQYSNWFFYRSGMNELEVAALNNGAMLKSSLELYAPLDEESDTPFENKAQSTNAINADNFVLGTASFADNSGRFTAYPNPVNDVLTIAAADNVTVEKLEVYNTLGVLVASSNGAKTINLASLASGVYLVKVTAENNASSTIKIIKK